MDDINALIAAELRKLGIDDASLAATKEIKIEENPNETAPISPPTSVKETEPPQPAQKNGYCTVLMNGRVLKSMSECTTQSRAGGISLHTDLSDLIRSCLLADDDLNTVHSDSDLINMRIQLFLFLNRDDLSRSGDSFEGFLGGFEVAEKGTSGAEVSVVLVGRAAGVEPKIYALLKHEARIRECQKVYLITDSAQIDSQGLKDTLQNLDPKYSSKFGPIKAGDDNAQASTIPDPTGLAPRPSSPTSNVVTQSPTPIRAPVPQRGVRFIAEDDQASPWKAEPPTEPETPQVAGSNWMTGKLIERGKSPGGMDPFERQKARAKPVVIEDKTGLQRAIHQLGTEPCIFHHITHNCSKAREECPYLHDQVYLAPKGLASLHALAATVPCREGPDCQSAKSYSCVFGHQCMNGRQCRSFLSGEGCKFNLGLFAGRGHSEA